MSVLIKGGRVVTATDDYVGDVFVDGERISLLGEDLDVTADTTIDASGKLVLPGLVDPHTHLDMPFGGTTTIDDVQSGQTAAAFGGTTCHVDFCIQAKGQTFADALADWHGKRDGKALIDMGYHIAITDLSDPERLEELASLPEQGVTSYKLFMAYKGALQVDDETLFKSMEVAAGSVAQTTNIAKTYGVIKQAPKGATNYAYAAKAVAQLKKAGVDVNGTKWKKATMKVTVGGK